MYKIRLWGTGKFVSRIAPPWTYGHRRPAKVHFVKGRNNPDAKVWKTLEDAEIALTEVNDCWIHPARPWIIVSTKAA
jgi:hypothetical protein